MGTNLPSLSSQLRDAQSNHFSIIVWCQSNIRIHNSLLNGLQAVNEWDASEGWKSLESGCRSENNLRRFVIRLDKKRAGIWSIDLCNAFQTHWTSIVLNLEGRQNEVYSSKNHYYLFGPSN